MYVFRIEREDGLGPWCNAEGAWEGAGAAWCDNAQSVHPVAYRHMNESKQYTWRFGFMSLDQMLHYMQRMDQTCVTDYDRERLHRSFDLMRMANLQISVYNIVDVYGNGRPLGDVTQVIFDLQEARLIKRIHPDSKFIRDYVSNYGSLTKELLAA